jgi:hypothetical protein
MWGPFVSLSNGVTSPSLSDGGHRAEKTDIFIGLAGPNMLWQPSVINWVGPHFRQKNSRQPIK